jgi:opacity protein-like surface antigen
MSPTFKSVISALFLLPMASAAQASEAAPSDWQFAATFYGWVSDLEGDIRAGGDVEPVDVDLSYGKVLEHLKFAAFGAFEARKDRLVLLSDLTYAHLGASSGIEVRDADLVDAELDATTFTATLLGGYRVAQGKVDVDLLAGARLVVSDTDLVLSGPQRTVEADVTKTWIDPIVAVQVGVPVSEKTTLTFYGDMGAGASDFTWQASAGVMHRLSERWQLTAAWRHYAVDYDKGQFLYDARQSGPVIGARYEF